MRRREGVAGSAPHRAEEASDAWAAGSEGEPQCGARAEAITAADELTAPEIAIEVTECGDCLEGLGSQNPTNWAFGDGAALFPIAPRSAGGLVPARVHEGPLCGLSEVCGGTEPAEPLTVRRDEPPPERQTDNSPAGPRLESGAGARRCWERQADRRRGERQLRNRSVAFGRMARGDGWSTAEAAAVLGLAPRTLRRWDQTWETDHRALQRRGRPPQIASLARQGEVLAFLHEHGPSVSRSTLVAEYPDLARAELAALQADFRAQWRREHAAGPCQLQWLWPGSVWAIDFTHPPHQVDGVYPAILNVRDLASHQQLLWLAVEDETASTVVEALASLFSAHGQPLVLKCDNGPGFRASLTKGFLAENEVFALYSPPCCAAYNGSCERANRTLKERTETVAVNAGRAGFWTSEDLLVARLRENRLSRPWGPAGATPEASWSAREEISLDKRQNMWQQLRSGIAMEKSRRGLDATVALPHSSETEIERIAGQMVLQELGLVSIKRGRIAPGD